MGILFFFAVLVHNCVCVFAVDDDLRSPEAQNVKNSGPAEALAPNAVYWVRTHCTLKAGRRGWQPKRPPRQGNFNVSRFLAGFVQHLAGLETLASARHQTREPR